MDRQDKHDGRYRRSLYPKFRPCNLINPDPIAHISYLPSCPVGRVAVYHTTCPVSCCCTCSIYGKGDEGKLHEYPQRRLSAYMLCKRITGQVHTIKTCAKECDNTHSNILRPTAGRPNNRVLCNRIHILHPRNGKILCNSRNKQGLSADYGRNHCLRCYDRVG